jgi:ABC-type Mn2+/Zn2+ transport system ATPase subunit
MRLRYIHLAHYPPLTDLKVGFSTRAPWSVFESQDAVSCSIHFVIGLNGSGKSHLLRGLAATFLALADERMPEIPVGVVYELGRPNTSEQKTVIFDCPGEKHMTSLWVAEGWHFPDVTDRETFHAAFQYLRTSEAPQAKFGGAAFTARIPRGQYPQAALYALPQAVLAYTSGAIAPWRDLWQPPSTGRNVDVVVSDVSDERPPGWTMEDEMRSSPGPGSSLMESASLSGESDVQAEDLFRRPILLEGVRLSSALLIIGLQHATRTLQENDEPLTELFRKGGWQRLVGVRLRINLDRALKAPRALLSTLNDLLLAAGEVIREPHPTEAWRSLYFDIEGTLSREGAEFSDSRLTLMSTQGQALFTLLGEDGDSAFERFGKLLNWSKHGLLEDMELLVRRSERPGELEFESLADLGVLRLSEFSDGERLVLARWALFHMLAGQDDALLLLDEPETHFNDAWKREIVGVVEEAMGRDASAVIVATHSAIVVSDVFDEEVVLVRKNNDESEAAAVPYRTFATDPSALMMTVFEAEDSIGRRAKRRIEGFMRDAAAKTAPSPEDVRQLEALVNQLGTGFYRTELRTLMNRWKQRSDLNAVEQIIPDLESDNLKDELRRLILKAQQPPTNNGEDGNA